MKKKTRYWATLVLVFALGFSASYLIISNKDTKEEKQVLSKSISVCEELLKDEELNQPCSC